MFSRTELRNPPGFFHFRWKIEPAVGSIMDVVVAFKVPGNLAQGVLVELIETVCRGPDVPDAVVLLQVGNDATSLKNDLERLTVQDALYRFKDRLPLMLVELGLERFSATVSNIRPNDYAEGEVFRKYVEASVDGLIGAGLERVFHTGIVVPAPEGYAFLKPSGKTAPYFIRAEAAMVSSGAIAFCALALWGKILRDRASMPRQIVQIMLDTMAISPVAFGLRELFRLAGLENSPVIESFHSYGGMERVPLPLRGSTLCLISASSSMEMHREWMRTKRVPAIDVVTLVTYDDAQDSSAALHVLPKKSRPRASATTAQHHISISGENFAASSESPRQVLLKRTSHSWPNGVKLIRQSAMKNSQILDIYRPSKAGSKSRRGLYVDDEKLLISEDLRRFLEEKLPQRVKAVTRQVIFQNDVASKDLATRVASYCHTVLGTKRVDTFSFDDVSSRPDLVSKDAGIVVVSTVIGSGSALLGVSRNLRGIHRGPRLYLIGLQVTETQAQVQTLDSNLSASAHGAAIDILKYGSFAVGPALEKSLSEELDLYSRGNHGPLPRPLKDRAKILMSGQVTRLGKVLLPSGYECSEELVLRKDFVFWDEGYEEGPHQAPVIATIAVLLQRSRESADIPERDRLFSTRPTHVTLDPQNFTRFDDGIIQAALLRSALPSELDFRSNRDASAYLKVYLIRCTKYLGTSRAEGALEFLLALCTGKLRLFGSDLNEVLQAFDDAVQNKREPLAGVVRWFVRSARAKDKSEGMDPI